MLGKVLFRDGLRDVYCSFLKEFFPRFIGYVKNKPFFRDNLVFPGP